MILPCYIKEYGPNESDRVEYDFGESSCVRKPDYVYEEEGERDNKAICRWCAGKTIIWYL